jgi:ABC-2 type transport system permease protein
MNVRQTKIYDSSSTPGVEIEEIRSVIKFKDLIFQLIRRDIVTRYKRSVLGVLWTMLNPLGTMVILSIVFSRMFNVRGVYPAYIITNLIAWTFFSQTTQFSLNATLWGSSLYHKIYMPRTAFIISTAGTGLVNLGFSLVPLTLIFIVMKVPINFPILLLPVTILLIGMFALGISLLLSTLVVFFPDIAEFYPVLLTAWMYLTPIIYPEELVADVLNGWLLRINPFYHLLKTFRMVLFEGVFPSMPEWLIAIAISVSTLIVGWVIFTRKSKSFGYYV